MHWINQLTLVLSVIMTLAGCTTSATSDSPIPTGGPSMLDIYNGGPREHPQRMAGSDRGDVDAGDHTDARENQAHCEPLASAGRVASAQQGLRSSSAVPEKSVPQRPTPLYADYLRTAANEIKVLFPRLPNPDIGIFVFPHLATDSQVPIPGYATVMPLYERVQYALPGERRVFD